MKHVLSILVAFVLANTASAQTDLETLWLRAVVIAEQNADFVPGLIVEKEAYWDDDGELQEEWELKTGIRRHPDGYPDAFVVGATFNGEDATAEFEEEFAKEAARIEAAADPVKALEEAFFDDEDAIANPFLAAEQPRIRLLGSRGQEVIGGVAYRTVSYAHEIAGTSWEGTAWLHEESGLPFKLELTRPVPFEDEENEVTITAVTVHVVFQQDRAAWYPLSVVAESRFEAGAFLWKFEGRSLGTTLMSEYWEF